MVVQLLKVSKEVTEEIGDKEEEEVDEADLIESAEETVEESPKFFQWLALGYQPKVCFIEATNTIDWMKYVKL